MKPIIFSGRMVRALLAGDKTQTRRPVKLNAAGRVKEIGSPRNWHPDDPDAVRGCPYGRVNDLLYVRETWALTDQAGDHPTDAKVVYRATDPDWETMSGWRWTPSIFMPRDAARIFLKITAIRIERLQAISYEDARAEGVAHPFAFSVEWNRIHAGRLDECGWNLNPLVWVVTFMV